MNKTSLFFQILLSIIVLVIYPYKKDLLTEQSYNFDLFAKKFDQKNINCQIEIKIKDKHFIISHDDSYFLRYLELINESAVFLINQKAKSPYFEVEISSENDHYQAKIGKEHFLMNNSLQNLVTLLYNIN